MGWWFGRMLTFEVEADEGPLSLAELLEDASLGLISASDARSVAGFAAHGTSVRDGLSQLIDICGVDLTDRDGKLRTPSTASPIFVSEDELGCDSSGEERPRSERSRSPASSLPVSVSVTYYDPDRDYQAGQMRASAGEVGARDFRIELPAVMTAPAAKQLVEGALARRWRAADRLILRLPPSRIKMSPGSVLQLPGSSKTWSARTVMIDGFAVIVEAEGSPFDMQSLPADPGRPVTEPDLPVGRSEVALFELPAEGDAPSAVPRVHIAASNAGIWKRLLVELTLGSDALTGVQLDRRAVIGSTETALDPRCPMILDELSNVTVRLFNSAQLLLNSDLDALMAGANLALVGSELLQFGKAEQLGSGLYRLSKLLRGRRGTEWAAASHSAGDRFCLIDPGAIRTVELNGNALGALLRATSHGIGDVAPLPEDQRFITGEAMRPPSPCRIRVLRNGNTLAISWVRRSQLGWVWTDGVGVADDPFPETYRVTAIGPLGQLAVETGETSQSFEISELPGQAGQRVSIKVEMVGPAALSRDASLSVTI